MSAMPASRTSRNLCSRKLMMTDLPQVNCMNIKKLRKNRLTDTTYKQVRTTIENSLPQNCPGTTRRSSLLESNFERSGWSRSIAPFRADADLNASFCLARNGRIESHLMSPKASFCWTVFRCAMISVWRGDSVEREELGNGETATCFVQTVERERETGERGMMDVDC